MQYINSNALVIGTILDKKYKILKILGEGGFGITYKAMDISLDRLCVIKEFLPSNFAVRSNDNTTVSIRSQADIDNYKWGLKSFIQEAKTLAKFQHPNIVHIITFFEANNTAYFEMPYEEGIDLEEYVKEIDSDFSEQQILDIAIPILNGLNEAHKRNILHRDIKPGNILLRENGMPMLIDFGAAREALGSKSHDLTQVLTPKYAPTEQYLSDRTKQGAFTDIYALGITLYLLITNQSASDIPAAPDRQDAVYINNQPDPLKKPEAGKYSQNLIDTIMKMIEIRSKDRPQDCDSVIEMLVTGICSSTKKETFTPDTELSDLDEVINVVGSNKIITKKDEARILQKAKSLNIDKNKAKRYLRIISNKNGWKIDDTENNIKFLYILKMSFFALLSGYLYTFINLTRDDILPRYMKDISDWGIFHFLTTYVVSLGYFLSIKNVLHLNKVIYLAFFVAIGAFFGDIFRDIIFIIFKEFDIVSIYHWEFGKFIYWYFMAIGIFFSINEKFNSNIKRIMMLSFPVAVGAMIGSVLTSLIDLFPHDIRDVLDWGSSIVDNIFIILGFLIGFKKLVGFDNKYIIKSIGVFSIALVLSEIFSNILHYYTHNDFKYYASTLFIYFIGFAILYSIKIYYSSKQKLNG